MVNKACGLHEAWRGRLTWRALILVLGLFPAIACGEVPFVGVNPGAPIWSGSILFTDALAADIASAGCHAVRINFRLDGNSTWISSHLAKYDQIIQSARNHDQEVLGLICYEAVSGTQAEWNENYATTGMNDYITEFAANASMLINRYKDDIKIFELWNEPDCWSVPPESNPLEPGGFYIWPKNYANVLAETYKKCVQDGGSDFFSANGISLSTGGLFAHDIGGSFATSRTYMTQVYQQTSIWDAFEVSPYNPAGRRYPWDYFGYHFYLNQGTAVSTSELASYFNDIRSMKTIYNDDTEFLLTEFGWNTQSVSEQLQADNLGDSYDWMRGQGDIATAYWYQWNDGGYDWGLVYSIGNPKPSYYEFSSQCGEIGPPVANFAAYPLAGTAPLTVEFTELANGVIDTYHWDFGDTTTSGEVNPTHEYTVPDTYSVTLTVTGPGGQDAETKVDYITVAAAPLLGDFDDDEDVDLVDFAVFAHCFTGSGLTTPPAGCENGSGVAVPATSSYDTATSQGGLSASIAASDLISGVSGTVEAGGFYSGVPGGVAGGLADLTDGVAGVTLEAVLADYSRPSLQVRYDFSPARHIEGITMFASNTDGRVFQNYDVEYSVSGESSYQTLLANVTTGPFGQIGSGSFTWSLTQIVGTSAGPIAVDVDSLRFIIYDVSTVSPPNVFWDEWDPGEPGDTDGNSRAYVATIVKEIDVFEYTGTVVGNQADFDGDGDADLDDFEMLRSNLAGPQ